METLITVILKPGEADRIVAGHLWIYHGEILRVTAPVADGDRQFIYAASPDGYVQKLAVSDGKVVWRTAITRLPVQEKLASPLKFSQGHVIVVTAGYIGDRPPYQGANPVADVWSQKALEYGGRYLRDAVAGDVSARGWMMLAASMAPSAAPAHTAPRRRRHPVRRARPAHRSNAANPTAPGIPHRLSHP